jgi:hypothetical protein
VIGLSRADWQRMRPELTPENQQVLQVWDFCQGWNPEQIPIAAAFFEISDLDFLMTQLLVLRERIARHQEAQRAAKK